MKGLMLILLVLAMGLVTAQAAIGLPRRDHPYKVAPNVTVGTETIIVLYPEEVEFVMQPKIGLLRVYNQADERTYTHAVVVADVAPGIVRATSKEGDWWVQTNLYTGDTTVYDEATGDVSTFARCAKQRRE